MTVAVLLAKNSLAPSGITAAVSAIDAGAKEKTWFRNNNFNNFKRKSKWYNENRSSSSPNIL